MKKFAAVALALILAMSSMFATVGVAATGEGTGYDTNELSIGFDIKNDGVVIDLENQRVYGLATGLKVAALKESYLDAADNYSMEVINEIADNVGTGSKIILTDPDGDTHIFDVIIFGDISGDSVIDVVDAAMSQRIQSGVAEATELALVAGDSDDDGEITANDYSVQVNAAVSEEDVDQKATGSDSAGLVEVEDQVYISGETTDYTLADEDVTLTFNDLTVDSKYYEISNVDYVKDEETQEIYGEVTITGKGLFSGEIKVKVAVVSLLEKAVATVNEVLEDANLSETVYATYSLTDGVADIKLNVNASDIIRGNFSVDMNGLNGLLTKIDEFQVKYLQEASLTVGDLAIATNGDFDRSAIKSLVFDIAKGLFCDIANADSNVVKSYSGVLVTNNEIAELAESFNIDVVMVADAQRDIERVKEFASKISRYVGFSVVDGNAVIDIAMPAGFATKVVDIVGGGDVETAIENVNTLNIYRLLGEYVRHVSPEDISAANATEIQAIVDMVASVDNLVNKVLGKVTTATVDVNGTAVNLLSGKDFVVEDASIDGLVTAFGYVLSEDVLLTNIAEFMNEDGVYEFVIDAGISIGGINETVIVNIDIFGDYEKKNAIEETVDYAEDILADLGVASFATVQYADGKAVAELDASALLADGLDSFNEEALDGLYTDLKNYFKANFGDSTITVGDYKIVTEGAINKAAVKDFLFDFVAGFFTDIANMDASTIRSYNTVVVDAEGNAEEFAFDFNLTGKEAHIEKLQTIAGKVAELVSFEEVDGNAVVNVAMPAGVTNKIVDLLGSGDAAEAQAKLNKLNVYRLLGEYVRHVSPEDISTTYADDIQTAIDMVSKMDSVINKLLGKVTTATVDVNGTAVNLLSGKDFVVEDASIDGLVTAFGYVLSEDVLLTNIAEFMNEDGSYTFVIDAGVSVGGIQETITVNIDIF